MKKIIISFVFATLLCLLFAFSVGAKDVYLEPIPDELKAGDSDTATHFVVFEEEKYFTISGTTITALNTDNMLADMTSKGIDTTKIGSTYLTRFNFPSGITAIDFEKVKSTTYFSGVAGYIQLPSTMTSVNNLRGQCSQLRCVNFSENSQLTSIGAYFCESAANLMSVKNFPRNLTSVGTNAFAGCYGAFKGELYVNATTISAGAFDNAIANVTKITLGPKVTTIGSQAFTVRMAEVKSSKPADSKIQVKEFDFQCDVSTVTFDSKAFYFDGNFARSPYEKLETIVLSHPNNEKLVVDGVSVLNNFTTSTVLFDATDGSTYYVTAIHNFVDGVMAYDSFLLEGQIVCTCTKCGATTTKNTPAIFTCNGYSVPLDGELAITVCYQIDFAALNAYQTSTGNTIEHGLVVAVKSSLGENAPLDENGDISNDSVLKATLNSKYTFFKTKLTNISEKHKDTTIILCGYVVERNAQGDITKIVYLEEEQTTAETLSGVSYTSVSSKAS